MSGVTQHGPRIVTKLAVFAALLVCAHFWLGPTLLTVALGWLIVAVVGEARRIRRHHTQPPSGAQRAGHLPAAAWIARRSVNRLGR